MIRLNIHKLLIYISISIIKNFIILNYLQFQIN